MDERFPSGRQRQRCPLVRHTAVRLKVEQNQLVEVFGKIGVRIDGLKGA